MSISIIPKMSPLELEQVLRHLPEPTYAIVSLCGNFDYSDISRQTEEVVKSVRLKNSSYVSFELENPSKEKILDIYRKSYELEDVEPTRETATQRRIDLRKAGWSLDHCIKIELTPIQVDVKYCGQEPDYITQMRQEVVDTNVRLKLEVNN